MSAYNQETFIRAVQGGARPNLFWVVPDVGTGGTPGVTNSINFAETSQLPFLIKASSMPETSIASIAIKYKGRDVPIPGDREYGAWNFTVYNTPDHSMRAIFDDWMQLINEHASNLRPTRNSDFGHIYRNYIVFQATSQGGVSQAYRIVGAWPTSLGEVSLDSESTSAIETFVVGFKYLYWEPLESFDIINKAKNLITAASNAPGAIKDAINIASVTGSSLGTIADLTY